MRSSLDSAIFAVLIGVVCAVGFVSHWEAADRFLSTVFAWVFGVGGGVLLLVVLLREAWGVAKDWQVMGPPGPIRRRRKAQEGEEEVRQQ